MQSESKDMQTVPQTAPAKVSTRRDAAEPVAYTPATDIYEREDSLVVVCDVPGVDEKSVDIQVERNLLTITATAEPEVVADHQSTYSEFEPGRFGRKFTLSDEVDCSRIEASVRDGVLRIVLPKAEAARPRKIQVRAG
jgi:HSP20 family protein